MEITLSEDQAQKIGVSVGAYGVTKIRESFIKSGKIGTGKSLDSLRYEVTVGFNFIDISFYGLDSILWIIRGRRPGGKLPVRKVGDTFELLPDLAEWRNAVAPGIPDFPLAKGIAERGIEAVPDFLKDPFELIRLNFFELLRPIVTEELIKQNKVALNAIFSKSII